MTILIGLLTGKSVSDDKSGGVAAVLRRMLVGEIFFRA
jgi:hypothetical protein